MPRLPELWHHQRLFVTDGNPPGVTGHAVDRSTQEFDGMYAGTPPWEIGRPQQVFVDAADAGKIRGRVLDAGCGTGEHVLMVAARGLDATGTDSSPRAIGMAKEKMAERNLTARFLVGDALELGRLGEQFDTVLDSELVTSSRSPTWSGRAAPT